MILAGVIAGIGVAWVVLRLLRRLPHGGRGYLWAIIPVFAAVCVGFVYVAVEYLRNKGPDDWGAVFHSVYVLRDNYGSTTNPKINMTDFDYVKDADDSASGTYRFHYRCADQFGVIMVHFDKERRKFDHDEIIPVP